MLRSPDAKYKSSVVLARGRGRRGPWWLPLLAIAWSVRSCCSSSTGSTSSNGWALLSVTNFQVDVYDFEFDGSNPDIYATVEVEEVGSSYTHYTHVAWDEVSGNFDWHVYVPSSAVRMTLQLWDRDPHILNLDDLIGEVVVDFMYGEGSLGVQYDTSTASVVSCVTPSTNCTLQLRKNGANIGTIQSYVLADAAMFSAAEALMARGRATVFGTPENNHPHSIAADTIEHEMGYAKTGSVFPEAMHGIWWMDQRCMYRPASLQNTDPSYVCNMGECGAADELTVSFGESEWDGAAKCARNLAVWDGPPTHGGHWGWMDQGNGSNYAWSMAKFAKQSFDFCYLDDAMEQVLAHVTIDPLGVGSFSLPSWILGDFYLFKKPWGWDRETQWGSTTCHYPVFQVVNGAGERTEHYDAYLQWANNQSNCGSSSFHCHTNGGNGNILLSRATSDANAWVSGSPTPTTVARLALAVVFIGTYARSLFV